MPPDENPQGTAQAAPVETTAPAAAPTRQVQLPYAQPQHAAPAGVPLDAYNAERSSHEQTAARLRQLESELRKRDALAEESKATLAKFTEQVGGLTNESKRLAEENRALKISSAVRVAAIEAGAVDPEDVVALTLGRFTLDESGNVIAADETKSPVKAALKAWLEKKPHLARPRVAVGSGASPFPAAAPSVTAPQTFDLRTSEGATAALHAALFAGLTTPNSKPTA